MSRGFHLMGGAALCVLLGGCEGGDSAPSPRSPPSEASGSEAQEPAERLILAETAWLSVSEEGEVYSTFLDPDGQYRDISNGNIAFEGTWSQTADSELCFAADQGLDRCWSLGLPDEAGEMRVTDREGRTIRLKRITYSPPAEGMDGEGDSDTDRADPSREDKG